jgi:hypothetical protein
MNDLDDFHCDRRPAVRIGTNGGEEGGKEVVSSSGGKRRKGTLETVGERSKAVDRVPSSPLPGFRFCGKDFSSDVA